MIRVCLAMIRDAVIAGALIGLVVAAVMWGTR